MCMLINEMPRKLSEFSPLVCDYNHGFSGFTIMDKHFSLSTSSTLRRDEKAHLQLIKGRTGSE